MREVSLNVSHEIVKNDRNNRGETLLLHISEYGRVNLYGCTRASQKDIRALTGQPFVLPAGATAVMVTCRTNHSFSSSKSTRSELGSIFIACDSKEKQEKIVLMYVNRSGNISLYGCKQPSPCDIQKLASRHLLPDGVEAHVVKVCSFATTHAMLKGVCATSSPQFREGSIFVVCRCNEEQSRRLVENVFAMG